MLIHGATVCRRFQGAAAFGLTRALKLSLIAASFAAACFAAAPAEARHRAHGHHPAHYASQERGHHFQRHAGRPGRHARSIRYARPSVSAPARNFAAIVVDGNSGRVLYARNEDAPRHPASITKVMTLYLLFEQLERGRLSLDSELRISAHAAAQKPTKLGLRAGQTITVENAIKAVVTRSANDMAVAIAEAIGGDEEQFAQMMTRRARELGMSGTTFVNASGLPDDAQITTARDLSVLGRVVQERFPRYYRYFSTPAFYYGGATIRNHNRLMERVEGMDGIKTGYTRSSGFNLLTSVKRNGRYIVAVVMGGVSAPSRDRIMAGLIEDQIDNGSPVRTASALQGGGPDLPSRPPVADADLPSRAVAPLERQASPRPPAPVLAYAAPDDGAQRQPSKLAVVTIAPKMQAEAEPVRVASIAPDVPLVKARPAFVPGAVRQPVPEAVAAAKKTPAVPASARAATFDGSTARPGDATASITTPSTLRWVTGPAPAKERKSAAAALAAPAPAAETEAARRPAAARSGWMIQIGATDDVAKANALLARAKADGPRTLGTAQPFTEKVQKGAGTLYRARFAGLEADSAEAACKSLKRSGFSCFATKN